MLSFARWALVPAVVAGWLLAGGPAAAVTAEVKDHAGFFSPDAVRRANETLRDLQRQYRKDVLIETFREPPDGAGQSVG